MTKTTRLLLTRHGQSEWNAQGRWQGQADPPLSVLGRRQAEVAAPAVGPVDAVVSSTLKRAYHTASIMTVSLSARTIEREPLLVERDAGEWSGLTRDQIQARWPGYLGTERRPPGYEPDELLLERALSGIQNIVERHRGKTVLVVTHGGVVYTLEAHLGESWRRMSNLSARWLVIEEDRIGLGDRVSLLDGKKVAVTTPQQI